MRRDYSPVTLEFWYSLESHYEDESEDISDDYMRITYEGETVEDALQEAAENWDYDDESVINFDAESDLIETTCDVVYIFERRGEEKRGKIFAPKAQKFLKIDPLILPGEALVTFSERG